MRLSDDLRTLGSWSKIDGAHCVPLCGMAMFSVLRHCDRPQVQIKGKIYFAAATAQQRRKEQLPRS
jgi:hypothetical protein